MKGRFDRESSLGPSYQADGWTPLSSTIFTSSFARGSYGFPSNGWSVFPHLNAGRSRIYVFFQTELGRIQNCFVFLGLWYWAHKLNWWSIFIASGCGKCSSTKFWTEQYRVRNKLALHVLQWPVHVSISAKGKRNFSFILVSRDQFQKFFFRWDWVLLGPEIIPRKSEGDLTQIVLNWPR